MRLAQKNTALISFDGPKKARRNVRKIEVPTDTPTEYELGDTAADIQRKREEGKQREREDSEKQQREESKPAVQKLHGGKLHRWRRESLKKGQELRGVKLK